MPLSSGTRVGPYEITSMLGSGGMGEVYRATDKRLNRNVAVKVLQPAVASGPDGLARFGREAQILAGLSHPHIAQVHGLEESDGQPALIMELVEGPTLADRVRAGALPLDEALAIARQIVEALETAHAAGIVHRDLKPANIKVRDDGTVKVLDFGLAKAFDPDRAGAAATTSPTISMHATAAGIILGTAAYMSPEQARGRHVDQRADIWAFGAVLYEMITGRRAFDADDTSDTLALVLTKDPDWQALPASTPSSIRRLLRRCLERDAKRRLPAIGVARLEIDEAIAQPGDAPAIAGAGAIASGRRQWLAPFVAGVAATAVLTAGAVAMIGWPAPPAVATVARFGITLPSNEQVAISFNDRDLTVSPDGTQLIYTAGGQAQLMIRPLDRLDPQPLAGITNARAPFVSADGRWIGFFDWVDEGVTSGPVSRGALRKVPAAGGPPTVVAQVTGSSRGATWGADDSIIFATSDTTTGLLRVSAGGGEPETLTRPDAAAAERDHHFPSVLPDGRSVLFTIFRRGQPQSVAVLDRSTGQWRTVIRSGSQAEYVSSGHLVYVESGALWAVRFDLATLTTVGDAAPLVERIGRQEGTTNFGISRDGMLAYASAAADNNRTLVWVDRQGREQAIPALARRYQHPRLSPDGTRAAVATFPPSRYWIWDFSLEHLAPLPLTPFGSSFTWSPDGRHLFYNRLGTHLTRRAADGTGTDEDLTTTERPGRPMAISPDGTQLVYEQSTPEPSYDLMRLALRGGQVSPLLNSPSDERNASISPDGRWIAYDSNQTDGRSQIYVRPFPNVSDAVRQISTDGGRTPLWAASGRELFFVSGSTMMAATIQFVPGIRVGSITPLFEAGSRIVDGRLLGNTMRTYDVSRDGQRFLMMKDAPTDGPAPPAIVVVQNWFEELRSRLPAAK